MSTILKSLKKLEEEKSLLEKNLDLQDLLVHDSGDGNYLSKDKVKRWIWVLGFISGSIVIGISVFFWILPKIKSLPSNELTLTPMKPIIKKIPQTFSSKPIYNGIAMSSIQEEETGYPLKSSQVKKVQPIKKEEISKSPENQKKVLDTSPKEENQPIQIVQETPKPVPVIPEEDPIQNQNEANETIVAAVQPVESELLPVEEEVEEEIDEELNEAIEKAKRMAQVEEETFPNMEAVSSLPDFQLRGIIFFGEDNPSNYIFYSTSSERNQKLRVGENVLGATLKQIDPERAIFSYQGRKAIIEIGN